MQVTYARKNKVDKHSLRKSLFTSGLEHFVDDISPLQKHADFLLLRVRRISGYLTMSTISKES